MTTIKLLRDDEGVLSLIRQNKATIDLEGNVEEVEPFPAIKPMAPRLPPERPPRSRDHRRHTARSARHQRGADRRRRQRRRQKVPIVLDTRSPHDRRTGLRRDSDRLSRDSGADARPDIGFDKFA